MLLDLVPKPLASRLEELLKQCDSLKEVVESLTLEEQSELAKGLVRLDVQLGLRPKPTWLEQEESRSQAHPRTLSASSQTRRNPRP